MSSGEPQQQPGTASPAEHPAPADARAGAASAAEAGATAATAPGTEPQSELVGAAAGSGLEKPAGGEGVPSDAELEAPPVSAALQAELEGMGFSSARTVRALHFTGSSSVEAAVNWIVEHEDDPDIDAPLLVPKEAAKPKLTPEEAKRKAEELREKARKKKEEEEKRMEYQREQDRIRVGKELLLAKQKAEDEERKRRIGERRREKAEEEAARQRILQKLEEDKRERRRRLGLPEEEPKKEAQAGAVAGAGSASLAQHPGGGASPGSAGGLKSLPVRPVSSAEKMRTVLRALKQAHKGDGAKVTRAFETMQKYVSNLGQHPEQDKFRRIRTTNAAFQERVGCYPESLEFFHLCGFIREHSDSEFLEVPSSSVDVQLLRAAAAELNSAITNPYFGVL